MGQHIYDFPNGINEVRVFAYDCADIIQKSMLIANTECFVGKLFHAKTTFIITLTSFQTQSLVYSSFRFRAFEINQLEYSRYSGLIK